MLEPEAASHSPPSRKRTPYVSTSGAPKSRASPWQPPAVPSGAKAQATDWPHKGANQPVESDESMSDLLCCPALLASEPQLPCGAPGAPSCSASTLGQAACTQGVPPRESSWGSGSGLQPTAVGRYQQGKLKASFRATPSSRPQPSGRRDPGPAMKLHLSLASCRLPSWVGLLALTPGRSKEGTIPGHLVSLGHAPSWLRIGQE